MASAGTIMLRSRYTDLFSSRLAYIDEILFENFDAPSLSYPKVFHVKDSGRAYEEVTGITGFGQFTEKDEGQPISYDVPLQGFDKRFTHLAYAKGYQISFEAMDDDLDGAITNAAPALARAARSSIEVLIWSVLNGGFATTTTPDGQYLFSDSHLQVNGGTADNLLSGDLTIANLESAIGMFDNMVFATALRGCGAWIRDGAITSRLQESVHDLPFVAKLPLPLKGNGSQPRE